MYQLRQPTCNFAEQPFWGIPFMTQQLKNPRFYLLILSDTLLFTLALVMAYLLRFEFLLHEPYKTQIATLLPWLIPTKLAVFFLFGLYRGMWRYTGMNDFWRLAQACFASSLLMVLVVITAYSFIGFPRSIFLLDCLLAFVLAGSLRVMIRSFYSARNGSHGARAFSIATFHSSGDSAKRILIIGAGGSGEKLLREIFDNNDLDYRVVGFLDDDFTKWGRAVHDIPVLGPVDKLPRILKRHAIDKIFISVPSATGPQMRRIMEICKSCKVSYQTLPALGEIMDGKVSIKALRDVNYEDLLRRPPVHLDTKGIEHYLAGQKVLVTGAGGSIGSELCRQVIRFRPESLILVDSGEANLYGIQMELRHELKFDAYHAILARVQNKTIMDEIFDTYRPDVVFHAAAYKHVPMIERNPWEGIFNNVYGSQVVMQTAAKYETKRFVLVSTDKAVRPTNVMGTTKRLTELILQSMQGSTTRFMAVRFGNVLASSGSVIPLFRKQIERGGPVTVTHPEVTRYFMTIPEAAQLILQAGAMGEGGEIFVLEMGTPVKIAEMAEDLIRLSGKKPGKDIEIVFTGLRAGEKLYEELITRGEDIVKTKHEKIMALEYNGRWNWNGLGNRERFRDWLVHELEDLYAVGKTHDARAIKKKLSQLVPEYTPQETVSVL